MQYVKGIDKVAPIPKVAGRSYQVGDLVLVKLPKGCSTTKFGKRQVDAIISPQTFQVSGMQHHMKDLHPKYKTTA